MAVLSFLIACSILLGAALASESALGRRVRDGVAWGLGAKVVVQLARWCATFLVIRMLTPDDYGVSAVSFLVVSFLLLLSSEALGSSIIQKSQLTDAQICALNSFVLLTSIFVSGICFWSAAPAAGFYQEPRLEKTLEAMSVAFLLTGLTVVPYSLLVRRMDFRRLAVIDVVSNLVAASSTLLLAYMGFGYWALINGYLAQLFVRGGLLIISSGSIPTVTLNLRPAFDLIKFSSIVTITGILWFAWTSADIAIAGRLWDSATLGLYTVALQLSVTPLNKVMPTLRQVAFPAFSEIQNDMSRVQSSFFRSLKIISAVMFPAFLGLGAVADSLTSIVLGDKWLGTAAPLAFICFSIPFRLVHDLCGIPVRAVGKPQVVLSNTIFAVSTMLPAFLIAAHYSVVGFAWVWAAVFPPVCMVVIWRACNALEVSVRSFLSQLSVPYFSALLMATAVYILGTVFESGVLTLVCQISVGILLYSLLILLFEPTLLREAYGFVRAKTLRSAE